MANNDNGGGTVLVAFMAGLAVGAAVALLMAPATGKEAREYLEERAKEGRDRLAKAAREGREAFNRERDHLRTVFERSRANADDGVEPEPQA
jgi:gas vesicle protein